ncbi:tetratricopeptide repeat-containing sensor histidine kinase [Labilibacter marinus]|uniref:tetratricopeptide repeat-containing sensor histidine kinase n=1 Tax=Labilibacter marinus TaxID=1477105 RepID=UPI00082E39F6|nr:tetratricopeptide repeat-containing sensor histidine kinase [Labilibacter marinus]
MRLTNLSFVLFFLLHYFVVNANVSDVDVLWQKYRDASVQGNDSLMYELCYEIAVTSRDPKIELHFAKKAYEIGKINSNINWQAAALCLNSTPYVNLMVLDSAIICLQESIELYRSVNNEEGIAVCMYRLADVHKRNKEYLKAEIGYKDVIKILHKTGLYKNLAGAYVNLGELYRTTNRHQLALDCYHAADSLYRVNNDDFGVAYATGNIGLVQINLNELDSAELYLKESIAVLEPLEDYYAVSCYLDGLAQVYLERNKHSSAKYVAQKSLKLAKAHALKEQIRDANLRLSTIYNESQEFEKAFFHHKQYVMYRDSINNGETIRKIANLNAKYKVAKKQKELDQEKADKQQYLIILIALVSVIGLLLVLGYFMLKVSRLRMKANKELELQHKELELANATKNKFFSILSHDLRSPLASFHGYSEVIDLCAQHNDLDKLSDISKEMQSSSANMLDLLDNLLQWGVNQMGTQEVILNVVNLREIVKIEVSHLLHVYQKKNIAININVEESCAIFVDRVRLSIAIRNLINNAIKFTPEGGNISIVGKKKNKAVKLKVKDNGVGMTEEQKQSLFNFNEINSTYGTKNEKGVGLGMQLVCDFIQSSHAKIDVESEVGKGTTFSIQFSSNSKLDD